MLSKRGLLFRCIVIALAILSLCGCAKKDDNTTTSSPSTQPANVAQAKTSEPASASTAVPAESDNDTFKPTKDITFVVGFDVGGTADIPARIIAKYMSKYAGVNVNVTNINISASRRIGAIVGHISDGNNHFSEISVINDDNHILTGVNTTSGQDIGGIVGFVQNDSKVTNLSVEVTNCLVQANLGSGNNRYCGGMIGRLDDRISGVTTTIVGCIFEGVMKVDNYAGGMINFTTGAGKLTITNCASNITTVKQGNTLLINEKNNSSIVGRYAITSGTGETIVNKCYGTLGEYYTFENGGNYEASQASIRSFTEENLINALINDIGLDTNIWGVSVSDSGAKIILK